MPENELYATTCGYCGPTERATLLTWRVGEGAVGALGLTAHVHGVPLH